jgi:hypothetical protein
MSSDNNSNRSIDRTSNNSGRNEVNISNVSFLGTKCFLELYLVLISSWVLATSGSTNDLQSLHSVPNSVHLVADRYATTAGIEENNTEKEENEKTINTINNENNNINNNSNSNNQTSVDALLSSSSLSLAQVASNVLHHVRYALKTHNSGEQWLVIRTSMMERFVESVLRLGHLVAVQCNGGAIYVSESMASSALSSPSSPPLLLSLTNKKHDDAGAASELQPVASFLPPSVILPVSLPPLNLSQIIDIAKYFCRTK